MAIKNIILPEDSRSSDLSINIEMRLNAHFAEAIVYVPKNLLENKRELNKQLAFVAPILSGIAVEVYDCAYIIQNLKPGTAQQEMKWESINVCLKEKDQTLIVQRGLMAMKFIVRAMNVHSKKESLH